MTGRGGPTELRERPGFLALCGHMGPVFSFQNRLTPFKRNHENESRSGSGGGEAETQFPSCSVRLLWPGIPQLHDTNKGCLRVLMFLGGRIPSGHKQKQLCLDASQPHLGPDVIPETCQGFLGIWIRGYPVGSFCLCVLPPQLSSEHRALR